MMRLNTITSTFRMHQVYYTHSNLKPHHQLIHNESPLGSKRQRR